MRSLRGKQMTIINTIDEYFPWIILLFTAIAEALLVLWFTQS
jgi:RsiW-degrading membrane proteinase PrsW (M82 family)